MCDYILIKTSSK